jgi:virginiamycin B lyase
VDGASAIRVGFISLTAALTLAAGAHAAPAVNGIYDVSDTPKKLAQGPDGNVWVVLEGVPNALARFSPDGAKQEFPLAGVNGAKGIATGPDGNLWLTASTQIVRVPPANPAGLTVFTVNDVIQPQAIVTGPDGNLWTGSADKVLKITTADPANPTLFTLTSTPSPSARGITSSGGLLWVVDNGGAIVSLTTAGVQTPYPVGGGPQEVGAGPNGQVLFSNPGASPQQVGRLVAGGTAQTTDRPLTDPFGITFGKDGAYWVADFASGDLARVTTDGAVTTLGGLPTNDPREITAGPNNTLWVSLELSKKVARVTGVDPPVLTPPITPPAPTPTVPVPVPAADTTAPAITKLRIRPARLRRGLHPLARITKPPAAKTAPSARVSLTLSEAASVTFTAERLLPGRRQGTRCAAPTRRNRRGRSCRRTQPAGGAVRLALPAGDTVLGFSGRLFKVLGPGSYRLLAVARDGAGNASAARRAAFTLLRASR